MKSFLGALGWLGVVLVVVAVVLRFVRPEMSEWYQRLALAGLVVTALYALSQWRDVARSFQGRNVKYGSIAASSVVLALGILVGVNYIASRQNKRWDLTAAGQFSLSDQTKQILGELQDPLTIKVFYTRSADAYRDRLSEYTYLSGQVSVDYVDAERDPIQAQQYDITTVPTFVLEFAGRSERATSPDEQNITNALKKVIEGQAKKAYFIQGHGERDPGASDPAGYSGIVEALTTDNFEFEPLTLAQAGTVPDDATLVVVAGPKIDLLDAELEALRAFLGRGGKVALLIDPPDKGVAADLTNVIGLAREWGADVGNDIVIDTSSYGQVLGTGASVPIAMPVQHTITDNFRYMTAFPIARSVTPIEGTTGGPTAQTFLETGPDSWGETDIRGLYETSQTERNLDGGDTAGPISIAVAASAAATDAPEAAADTPEADPATPDVEKPESRVVVIGDSDFASNGAIGIQGNREMFLNVANWLAQQEDLIAIRPRSAEDRPIAMTADQQSMVFWFTMVLVPAMLFGTAVRLWWIRR